MPKSRKHPPPAALDLIADRFRALSEVPRLKLIMALHSGERSVSELVAETGLSQTNTSRHLQILVEAGILGRRKSGLNVIYSIADQGIFTLCEQVCGSIERTYRDKAKLFQ